MAAPVNAVVGLERSIVSTILSPLSAAAAPGAPTQTPMGWTLLAFARREFDRAVAFAPPVASAATAVALSQPSPSALADAAAPVTFTGEPSIVTQVLVVGMRIATKIGNLFGVNVFTAFAQLLSTDTAPWYLAGGLDVQRSEFNGWQVWTLTPSSPTGKYVVALHGGGFVVGPAIVPHWFDYTSMARDTGATVVVPIYPLAPQGGTADKVVPQAADLISALIDQHGADAVSVYGDSAGATIAMLATQELVRRGSATPSRMVLISPLLDATLSNPAIASIDDPLLDVGYGLKIGRLWAGDLDLDDPMVSPLYGSIDGLPPTWIYSGSLDILSADVLRLQDEALAQGADNFHFILRKGEPHDWALPLLDGAAVRNDIYDELFGPTTAFGDTA